MFSLRLSYGDILVLPTCALETHISSYGHSSETFDSNFGIQALEVCSKFVGNVKETSKVVCWKFVGSFNATI